MAPGERLFAQHIKIEAVAFMSKLVIRCSSLPSLRKAVDWVIHLDHDELFLPPPQGLQAFLLQFSSQTSRRVLGKQAHFRHLDASDCRWILCFLLSTIILPSCWNFFEVFAYTRTLKQCRRTCVFREPSRPSRSISSHLGRIIL